MANTIDKYLAAYAEPEISDLLLEPGKRYDAFCVIPIYDESFHQIQHFLSHQSSQKIALIWVLNSPEGGDFSAQKRTSDLFSEILNQYAFSRISDRCLVAEVGHHIDLYLIDRCTLGQWIPAKQGVGLARKLGLDLALKIIQCSASVQQECVSWLHCCDADVRLPKGYFEIPLPTKGQSASIYPFKHEPEAGFELAMALYDLKLEYYKQNLVQACSPYAFHTIGSTIAVTPLAYAQVRGMPKRAGGEDFYFLNKLAKVGQIKQLELPLLKIAGRPSHRVPFGTGPALVDLHSKSSPVQAAEYYHPYIFVAMKQVVKLGRQITATDSWSSFARKLSQSLPEHLREETIHALEELRMQEAIAHLSKGKNESNNPFDIWFDGFRTLKFVHAMRRYFPSLNLSELNKHASLLSPQIQSSVKALLEQ